MGRALRSLKWRHQVVEREEFEPHTQICWKNCPDTCIYSYSRSTNYTKKLYLKKKKCSHIPLNDLQ